MRQEAERVPFSLPCCAIRIIPFRLAKPSAPPCPSSADTLRSALRPADKPMIGIFVEPDLLPARHVHAWNK
ncbi:hypothetical protein [Paenibacillus thiaminolyticus]|uniref:hypothetical protein n=1 Tax=Paenibacillus thiaminolyticus TaxID=49283 RepID=UPI0011C344C1|nr:hypothetical protein [Paenibacillus thiaminolyticus]